MRLLYVITHGRDIGGAQLHVRDLAEAMSRRGHDVRVLIGAEAGPIFDMLDAAGVPFTKLSSLIRPLRPATDVRCVFDLMSAMREFRPDVVHCHSSKAGILGRLAAHRVGVPAVFSAHGWSFADGIPAHTARPYLLAERAAARWCQRILTGCERDRRFGLDHGVGDEQLIETIWYGIHELDDGAMADPTVDPPKIAMVARFGPQKDHETLIRALGRLSHIDWSLELLGEGDSMADMQQLAKELGIVDRIGFLGQRPTRDTLLSSQVFALITNWEGLPLSTLEGMSVGLPLIGSDVGGLPEEIVEGETGFVVPRGDVGAVARQLELLLTDPELRRRMGQAGRARFVADFQYDRMADRVEAVYNDIAISVP